MHPKFEWSQDNAKLEVRIALSALNNAKPSDINVEVRQKDTLVVSVGTDEVLRHRLHDDVTVEDFVVENGSHLVVDCRKNDAEMWPALLRLPLSPDDPRILSPPELDSLLRKEMMRLPLATDLDDPDDLLDDAFEEIQESSGADPSGPKEDDAPASLSEAQQAAVARELEMTEKEFTDFDNLLESLKAKAADESLAEEEREKAAAHVELLKKIIELSKDVRRLRSKRPTMDILLEILRLEIWKGRLNHSAADQKEEEAFRDDTERDMSAHELMTMGLKCLEENNVEDAMHYIRLAAIHHNHPVSTCLLQRLYTQMRVLPKAAYFVFHRALLDDLEPSTNLIVGEFVDKGMPLFPPYMALAVFFYQRAAMVGSTHAMITLANTFKQGALSASPASEDSRKANADDRRFLEWIQAAEDRGSPRAYFTRAILHLTGEYGQTKSYALAKAYLDRVKRTEPSLLSKAPGVEARLAQLKAEEELKDRPKSNASDAAPAASRSLTATAPQSAASRLAALERSSGAGAGANMEPVAPRTKKGMLSKGPLRSNKGQVLFERMTRWAVGLYFSYILLFPARVMIMPQAFAVLGVIVDVVGAFLPGGRQSKSRGLL